VSLIADYAVQQKLCLVQVDGVASYGRCVFTYTINYLGENNMLYMKQNQPNSLCKSIIRQCQLKMQYAIQEREYAINLDPNQVLYHGDLKNM